MIATSMLKIKIKKYDNVFIMAHKDLDFDALGSMLGMYYLVTSIRTLKDKCYLVVEEKKHESGVSKVFEELKKYPEIKIISYRKIKKQITNNSLLIITDTRKKELVQSEELFENVKNKIIVDHHSNHEMDEEKNIEYIGDDNISSTCEILTPYLKNIHNKIPKIVLTTMLCGIKIDTADFNVKTTYNTFKAASDLIKLGADNKMAKMLLKQQFKDYLDYQDLITKTEIIDEKIAISYGYPQTIYEKEKLAKVSNALLNFEKIELSFAIGRIKRKEVGISARSLGTISVQKIMQAIGGGGDKHDAATRLENISIYEAKDMLLEVLKNLGVIK